MKKTGKFEIGSKMWVLAKKERQRRKVISCNLGYGSQKRLEVQRKTKETLYVNAFERLLIILKQKVLLHE